MKYRLKPRIVEASLQQDGFWAVNDGESICFFYEEQFKEKFEPVEDVCIIPCKQEGKVPICKVLPDKLNWCDPTSLHNLNNQID